MNKQINFKCHQYLGPCFNIFYLCQRAFFLTTQTNPYLNHNYQTALKGSVRQLLSLDQFCYMLLLYYLLCFREIINSYY